MRCLAPFANRPHHERLAPAHIARSEDLRARSAVFELVGLDVAAGIEIKAQILHHAPLHGMEEAHGEQDKIRGDVKLRTWHRLELAVETYAFKTLDLAVRAQEAGGRHAEIARGALRLARRSAELERPMRPSQSLVLLLGRLRKNLELRHRDRTLTERGADAVGAGIAAADHHHALPRRKNRFDLALRFARNATVLLRQIGHGEVDAFEIAARDFEVAGMLGTAREQNGVIVVLQRLDGEVEADMNVAVKSDAFGLHLLHAAFDDVFLHLEIGNAVAEQAAGKNVLLVNLHVVAGAGELLRRGKSGGA